MAGWHLLKRREFVEMTYTTKQWRKVIQLADVGLVVVSLFILALVSHHYVQFKEFILPLEGALFLIPWPVLRAVAAKEMKKCQALQSTQNSSV